MRARKRPVEVEFFHAKWGCSVSDMVLFTEGNGALNAEGQFYIKTLEGNMIVSPNDYIIKGVNGEFYPCKPDIFEKTYDILN